MNIRKAVPADSPWRPTWRRNVYPVLEDLVGDLFIAEQEGEGIVGAILVNDRQGEGYEEGLWSVNTDQVAVTHLLAVSAAHRGEGIARGLLSRARAYAAVRRSSALTRWSTTDRRSAYTKASGSVRPAIWRSNVKASG